MLLVPADPLNPRRVDPHFAPQADAARDLGIPVARIDHDALDRPADAVAGVPAAEDAVYRGWMMTATQYTSFATALTNRNVHLRTTPKDYRTAHELPGWYQALHPATPESAWTTPHPATPRPAAPASNPAPQPPASDSALQPSASHESPGSSHHPPPQAAALDQLDLIRQKLGSGPAIIRDYVKSAKHHWHEATYIPDLADADAVLRVAEQFLELRDDSFTGGFVLRRFEEFTGPEARTWWIGGRCALITPHPDTPDDLPADLDLVEIEPLVSDLALPFVTVDVVRRADGTWRVVELGDGQVSDWPTSRPPEDLIRALFA